MRKHQQKIKHNQSSSIINIPILKASPSPSSKIHNPQLSFNTPNKMLTSFLSSNRVGTQTINNKSPKSYFEQSIDNKVKKLLSAQKSSNNYRKIANLKVSNKNQKDQKPPFNYRDEKIHCLEKQVQQIKFYQERMEKLNKEKEYFYEQKMLEQVKKSNQIKNMIIFDLKKRLKQQQCQIKTLSYEKKQLFGELEKTKQIISKLKVQMKIKQQNFLNNIKDYEESIEQKQIIIKKMSNFNDQLCLKLVNQNLLKKSKYFSKSTEVFPESERYYEDTKQNTLDLNIHSNIKSLSMNSLLKKELLKKSMNESQKKILMQEKYHYNLFDQIQTNKKQEESNTLILRNKQSCLSYQNPDFDQTFNLIQRNYHLNSSNSKLKNSLIVEQ